MSNRRFYTSMSSAEAVKADLASDGILDTNGIGTLSAQFAECMQKTVTQTDPVHVRIDMVGIDEEHLEPYERYNLHNIQNFLHDFAHAFTQYMHSLMAEYATINSNFSENIQAKMRAKQYDAPLLTVYSSSAANTFLRSQEGLEHIDIAPDSFLVNFNFPKPMNRFYYRNVYQDESQKIAPDQIQWGDFYHACLPLVWSFADTAIDYDVHIQRVNAFGQHGKEYYYLWQM